MSDQSPGEPLHTIKLNLSFFSPLSSLQWACFHCGARVLYSYHNQESGLAICMGCGDAYVCDPGQGKIEQMSGREDRKLSMQWTPKEDEG